MSKEITLRPYDVVEYLRDDADMAAYLEAALEDGDPTLITHVLGDIARARGMAQMARDTGLGRESLYKALSGEGNPEFATIMKVVKALGLQLHASAVAAEPAAAYAVKRKVAKAAGKTVKVAKAAKKPAKVAKKATPGTR
jgi:probable addiction module antidote protein